MSDKPLILEVAEGLLIFAGYGKADVCAEHDIIYAGPISKVDISAEDQIRLEELNWHVDEENDSWAHFV
ncbi:hypothetical protein UFOVP1290_193 [uncultured Caudovirales phage]|uniref:Uncharacterized protein n=1 Tax=uncultured Caudovirales phage TaxID=2100421 RepID=A0A6J5RH41_9CAUD|nr:hypothetical protein UFOVP1290_193 [uncultured Caudovirales phage]